MRGLQGRTALVTGAARGIGYAIAEKLAREGVHVVMADVNAPELSRAAGSLTHDGYSVVPAVGDVSVVEDGRAMVSTCISVTGQIDFVINNARIDHASHILHISSDDWQRIMSVDLWGSCLVTQDATHELAKNGGVVVNISSTHALATVAGRSAYAAAKNGVVGLTRGLAIDLGPMGIRVNARLPVYIETPIWDLWLKETDHPEDLLHSLASRHPVRRLGKPDDVDGVAAFLCSDDATFITGSLIVVDGGNPATLEHSPILE